MSTWKVKAADEGIRLDRWFKRHMPGVSHIQLEKHLRKGEVRLNGKKAKAGDRIAAEDEISSKVVLAAGAAPKQRFVSDEDAQRMLDAVLYKDERVIVINKPAGLAVQGGTGQKTSVDGQLDALRFGGERPKLVHRIDKDTSGCLALARSSNAAAELSKLFAGRDVEKTYLALCVGLPQPFKGTIDAAMLKAGGASEKMELDDAGKHAITEYKVLEHCSDVVSLVELKPITGRMHQLRVHMASIGHPLLGDGKYGGKAAHVDGPGISGKLHLHAWKLSLPGKKPVKVTAPLPEHMLKSMDTLGIYTARG